MIDPKDFIEGINHFLNDERVIDFQLDGHIHSLSFSSPFVSSIFCGGSSMNKSWAADAMRFAVQAHADQTYGSVPYSHHLVDVQVILSMALGDVPDAIKDGAWLHDAVEDTEVTLDQIGDLFGLAVMNIVSFCTDCDGKNRKERKVRTMEKWHERLAQWPAHPGALVKGADRIANVLNCIVTGNRGLFMMYLRERNEFASIIFAPRSNAILRDEVRSKFDSMALIHDRVFGLGELVFL